MVSREEVKAYEYLGQKLARREPHLSRYALNENAAKLAVLDWLVNLEPSMTLLDAIRLLNEKLGAANAVRGLDSISQMALRLGPLQMNTINVEREPDRFMDLAVRIINDPNPVLVTGNLRTGKTDFALLLGEKALEMRWAERIVTNIEVSLGDSNPYRFRVKRVHSSRDIQRELGRRGRKVLIIDEAGIHISARRSVSKKNMFFVYLTRLSRKHKAKMIYITQKDEDLDKAVRDLCTVHIHKHSLKTAEITLKTPTGDETIWLENIPRTTIPFDTLSTAPLEIEDNLKI